MVLSQATPQTGDSGQTPGKRIGLQQALDLAQQHRLRGQWQAAARLYTLLLPALPQQISADVRASVHHNLALCLFALRDHAAALVQADLAFGMAPSLWQSGLIAAQASKSIETPAQYMDRVARLHSTHPGQPQIRLMYGQMLMNHMGDAHAARQATQDLANHPVHGAEVSTLLLMSRLYDRDESDSAQAISDDIRAFAKQSLTLSEAELAAVPVLPQWQLPAPVGQRIGILSNLLSSSPVHAFGIQRMRQWRHAGHELVFIQRGNRTDWATEEFRALAAHWVDAVGLSAAQLHVCLRSCQLDQLYEMGGWMDLDGLKAVSIKPAPKLYKWVGGQSCTTGLDSFDGYLSDASQSPPELAHLYSEPLQLEAGSYVDYTPPVYLRDFQGRASACSNGRWGVIANPVKLSRAFLLWLADVGRQSDAALSSHRTGQPCAVSTLVLADYRYASHIVRQRIESVLRPAWGERLVILAPEGHKAFIETLVGLQGLIDTFPYSCGLTMVEALYVGLDVCFPAVDRQLFCERHGWAHVINRIGPPALANRIQ